MRNKKTIYWYANSFPKVQRVGLKAKNSYIYSTITIFSLLFFPKFSLSIFLNTPSYCTSPPFIGTFSFLLSPVDLLLVGFKRYLSPLYSAILSSWNRIFGSVSTVQASLQAFNVEKIRKRTSHYADVTAFIIIILSWHFLRRV